jgi:hypothetical protein
MDWGLLVPLLIVVFIFGMAVGTALEARTWRRNAEDHLRRKWSGGRLYKVSHAR